MGERLFAESGALLKGSGVKLALESRSVPLNGIELAAEVPGVNALAGSAVRLSNFSDGKGISRLRGEPWHEAE